MLWYSLMLFVISNSKVFGDKLFNVGTQVCCDGKILPKPFGGDYLCCGHSFYRPQEQLCCGGRSIKLPPDAFNASTIPPRPSSHRRPGEDAPNLPHYACCGDNLFNYDTELCCEDTVVMKPVPDDGLVKVSWSCCGKGIFNYSTHDCCQGKLLEKNSISQSCCGNQLIDNSKQLCCAHDYSDDNEQPVILPREHTNVGCCGRNRIDHTKEACCMNNVVPLPDDANLRRKFVCCGDTMWTSPSDEICCGGQIIKKKSDSDACCSQDIFNIHSQLCCDDIILPKVTNSTFCCGQATYEEGKEVCCQRRGKALPMMDPENTMCCD